MSSDKTPTAAQISSGPAPSRDRWARHPMVAWYDPFQLLDTGIQVVVSELVGARSDYRLIESLAPEQDVFDYTSQAEIWVDYVADLGDGWNSTYAIASALAAEHLAVRGAAGPVETKRGRVLIMGGDQVYPAASRDGYEERTVQPYECAFAESAPTHPELFSIPGNHDWYDGLVSFSRLFCQNRWIGGWKTRQRRSYFALKLPGRWWIWGVDIQLESDVDQPQLDYFRSVTAKMTAGDRVILVTAEPHWIYGNIYDAKYQSNLAFLEESVIQNEAKASLQVALAGDLHHYRRHESVDGSGKQLITSGGGGAFLHPTYGPSVATISVGKERPLTYALKSAFPSEQASKRLLRRNFLFPFINPTFGLLTGLTYLVLAWLLQPPIERELMTVPREANTWEWFDAFIRGILTSPSGVLWIFLLIVGFIFFTDTHKPLYKFIAGTLHALAHLTGIVVAAAIARSLAGPQESFFSLSSLQLLVRAGVLFAGGYIVGSFLMGIYLYISLRIFRRHSNEAFSSLRIPDYKNFVRMHITSDGSLTIYPIGLEKVPRHWRPVAGNKSDPQLVPEAGEEIVAHLIEPPIKTTAKTTIAR